MSHAAHSTNDHASDFAATCRAILGTSLILIGVAVGLCVVFSVFQILNAKGPPALVASIVQPMEPTLDSPRVIHSKAVFDLSNDVKRMILCAIIFFMMIIPMVIATNLVSCGVRLTLSDPSGALQTNSRRLSEQRS